MKSETRQFELSFLSAREKKSKWYAILGEACRRTRVLMIEADCEGIPIDLKRFAKHLGIASIRTVPLSMKGRLITDSNHLVIEVGSDLNEFDRRFTIAHEIAHIIVEGRELGRKPQPSARSKEGPALSNKLKEKLCDAVATEMLLPYEWIRDQTINIPPSIECIMSLADRSKASIEAVVERIVQLGLWDCRILWWRIDGGYFRAVRSAPFITEDFLCFIKPQNQRSTLLRRCAELNTVVVGQETILYKTEVSSGKFQCRKLDDGQIISVLEAGSR